MANRNYTATMFLNSILLISLLLLVSMAEGRSRLFDVGLGPVSTPTCDSAYGVQDADTCFAITQLFNMTNELFTGLNPNLNCDKLFVCQWLCVAGTVN